MKRRTALWIAWVVCLALTLLHLDFWRPQRVVLWLGWIPEELSYRLLYVLVAWLFMVFVCVCVWREDGER
jgi:hypothetical protein